MVAVIPGIVRLAIRTTPDFSTKWFPDAGAAAADAPAFGALPDATDAVAGPDESCPAEPAAAGVAGEAWPGALSRAPLQPTARIASQQRIMIRYINTDSFG